MNGSLDGSSSDATLIEVNKFEDMFELESEPPYQREAPAVLLLPHWKDWKERASVPAKLSIVPTGTYISIPSTSTPSVVVGSPSTTPSPT